MAIEKHVQIVKQGAEAINEFKRENPGVQLDLSGANLRRAQLEHADLREVKFCGINMEWADLRWADLMNADFTGANLERADFHKADMQNANFKDAILLNTNLEDANLIGANLSGAQFGHTRMYNTDFGDAEGLTTAKHDGPSILDMETISKSGYLPSVFLKGCGLSDPAVKAALAFDEKELEESLGSEGDYYSCFISYSSRDSDFASQLYDDLQKYSVRCWIAERDMRTGDQIRDRIHKVIRKNEKLLLILSKNSVESSWVGNEVEKAFNEENDRGEPIIFPVRIDDAVMSTVKAWAETIRIARHIGDFSGWKDKAAYDKAFNKLLDDLKKNRED